MMSIRSVEVLETEPKMLDVRVLYPGSQVRLKKSPAEHTQARTQARTHR